MLQQLLRLYLLSTFCQRSIYLSDGSLGYFCTQQKWICGWCPLEQLDARDGGRSHRGAVGFYKYTKILQYYNSLKIKDYKNEEQSMERHGRAAFVWLNSPVVRFWHNLTLYLLPLLRLTSHSVFKACSEKKPWLPWAEVTEWPTAFASLWWLPRI